MVAEEVERLVLHKGGERDAEAAADIFLEPRRPGEALRAVDHLREAAAAAVEPGPELAAARLILGDGDDSGDEGLARQRQRTADQPRKLRQRAPAPAHPALDDLPGIDDAAARAEVPAEARPNRFRQPRPSLLADEGAETQVAEFGRRDGGPSTARKRDDFGAGFALCHPRPPPPPSRPATFASVQLPPLPQPTRL